MTDSSYILNSDFLRTLLDACFRVPADKANGYAVKALAEHGVTATLDKGTQIHLLADSGETLLLDWSNRQAAIRTVARIGEFLGY